VAPMCTPISYAQIGIHTVSVLPPTESVSTDEHVLSRPVFALTSAPSRVAIWTNLVHGSFGPHESTSQTASRSVQTFMQGSQSWQTTLLHL